jgi:fermentation-respiration switch protein FrsA (DUF1100 family)
VEGGSMRFHFQIGDRVKWTWRSDSTWSGSGLGTVVSRRFRDEGMSSPADYYVVKNDNDIPFPFVDLQHPILFKDVTDPTQYEFIYGVLEKA